MERHVVGVFGNKQHGKDTTAKLIEDVLVGHGKRVRRLALADPLKNVAQHLLGMPPEIAWGHGVDTVARETARQHWTRYGKNAREWLQWIGTELGRDQIDSNLWIDRVVDLVSMDADGTQFFVITDCRFNNEREQLFSKLAARFIPFIPVRVYRPGIPVDDQHPSEAEVAAMPASVFDHVLDNDSDLDGLRSRVTTYVTQKFSLGNDAGA